MRRVSAPVAGLLVAPVVAVALLWILTEAPAAIPGLPAPSRVVTWGLPAAQALRDIGAVVTVGALVVLATCLVPDPANSMNLTPVQQRVRRLALIGSAIWSSGNLVLLVFSFADASGLPMTSSGFWDQAWFFAMNYEQGISLTWGSILSLGVLFSVWLARHPRTFLYVAMLAIAGLWTLALSGHGAAALNHNSVVDLQFAHWIGVAVWGGGVLALVSVRRLLGHDLPTVARRFSSMATWSLVLVGLAGLGGALLRLDSVAALRSDYGLLLGLKVGAIAALALAGLSQRRRLLRLLDQGTARAFGLMLAAEAGVILAAVGIGVALSRTSPPGRPPPVDATTDALGYALPPVLEGWQWVAAFRPDALWLPAAAVAVAWYVRSAHRLRARGDRWPAGRQIAWILGWVLMIWATSGAPGVYSRVLFSAHMVQHMTIATAVPVFLVLGAPVTLALRSLPRRADGSIGPREAVQALVHSPVVQILGRPLVAVALFIVSLVAFYYSSLFELALTSHTAHVAMTLHFLLTGYLFASCLVGIDPGTRQPAFPFRVLMVMVTFGLHSLFSVSLMAKTDVLAADWYQRLDRPWGATLIDDQYLGASLGWALGDYPLAILAGVLVFSWVQADRRESRRFDRNEERRGDAELTGYNEYLARLSSPGDRDS